MAEWSESGINLVYLMLGSGCNYSCRYCIEHGKSLDFCGVRMPNDTVLDYIKHLTAIRPDTLPKLHITFWGGEPLLYFDAIKYTLERLGDSVTCGLVTNGAFITDEFVEYANAHNMGVTLSNDGVNTVKTRKENLLEDKDFCERFKRINIKTVECVTSAYNYDYSKLISYVHSKIPDVEIRIAPLCLSWNMPKDIYNIPLDKYRKSLLPLAQKAYNDFLSEEETPETEVFMQYLKRMERFLRADEKIKLPQCRQFYEVLNVDTEGNVYACHSTNVKIGRIGEQRIVMLKRFNDWLAKQYEGALCGDCTMFPLCGGGCPLESGDFKKRSCINRIAFYEVVYGLINALNNSYELVDLEV